MLIRWQILISHLFFEGRTNVNKPSEIKKPLIKHWFYDINIFAQAAIKRLYTYIILWFKCYLLAKNIYYTAGHFWSIWVEKRWKFIDVFYGWSLLHTAHSKVLLLRAYLKVTFHETMAFSFILGSNRPNQMPRGISENFCTPRGARVRGWGA